MAEHVGDETQSEYIAEPSLETVRAPLTAATALSLDRGLSVTIHFGTVRDAGAMFDVLKDLYYGPQALPMVLCFLCNTPLLAGPRGGMSVDMACPSCRQEFCVPVWRGEVIREMVKAMGRLTDERAHSVYGLAP